MREASEDALNSSALERRCTGDNSIAPHINWQRLRTNPKQTAKEGWRDLGSARPNAQRGEGGLTSRQRSMAQAHVKSHRHLPPPSPNRPMRPWKAKRRAGRRPRDGGRPPPPEFPLHTHTPSLSLSLNNNPAGRGLKVDNAPPSFLARGREPRTPSNTLLFVRVVELVPVLQRAALVSTTSVLESGERNKMTHVVDGVRNLQEVDLVPQDAADSTEASNELGALLTSVRDLKLGDISRVSERARGTTWRQGS